MNMDRIYLRSTYSFPKESVTLQQCLWWCEKDLDRLASKLTYRYALPLHEESLMSSRIGGIYKAALADLEDMANALVCDFSESETYLIPWSSSKARALTREQALACKVDLSDLHDELEIYDAVVSMVWDLMEDSYPVWSE